MINIKNLFSNITALLLVTALSILCQFGFLKVLTSSPGEGVAGWAVYEIFLSFISATCLWGGEFSLINRISKDRSKAAGVLSAYQVLLFFIALFFSLPVLWFMQGIIESWNAANDFFLFYSAALFSASGMCLSLYLRSDRRFFASSLLEKLPVFIFTVLVLLYWVGGWEIDVASLVLVSSVPVVIVVLYFILVLAVRGKDIVLREELRSSVMHKGSAEITATNIVIFVYERIDQILVAMFFGPSMLAVYFVCYKMSFFVRFLSKATNQVFYVYLSKAVSKVSIGGVNAELNSTESAYISLNLKINCIVAFLFCLVMVSWSKFLLGIFGGSFAEHYLILDFLCIALFISTVNQVFFNVINAKSGGRYYFKNALIVTSVQVFLMFVLFDVLGFYGVVLARVCAVLVGNLNAQLYLKDMGTSYKVPKYYYAMLLILISVLVFKEVCSNA